MLGLKTLTRNFLNAVFSQCIKSVIISWRLSGFPTRLVTKLIILF